MLALGIISQIFWTLFLDEAGGSGNKAPKRQRVVAPVVSERQIPWDCYSQDERPEYEESESEEVEEEFDIDEDSYETDDEGLPPGDSDGWDWIIKTWKATKLACIVQIRCGSRHIGEFCVLKKKTRWNIWGAGISHFWVKFETKKLCFN